MLDAAKFHTATTPFGAPMLASPDAAARLAACGLHRSDPRYDFALSAVRAAPMNRRAAAAERFRQADPIAVPLPPIAPGDAVLLAAKPNAALSVQIVGLQATFSAAPTWSQRDAILNALIGLQIEGNVVTRELAITGRALITAALEACAEPAVTCIEQAAYLAVSMHQPWRLAALHFIEPITRTWFADWLVGRPDYQRFAEGCAL